MSPALEGLSLFFFLTFNSHIYSGMAQRCLFYFFSFYYFNISLSLFFKKKNYFVLGFS